MFFSPLLLRSENNTKKNSEYARMFSPIESTHCTTDILFDFQNVFKRYMPGTRMGFRISINLIPNPSGAITKNTTPTMEPNNNDFKTNFLILF